MSGTVIVSFTMFLQSSLLLAILPFTLATYGSEPGLGLDSNLLTRDVEQSYLDLYPRDADPLFGFTRGAGCCFEWSTSGRCLREGAGEQCAPSASYNPMEGIEPPNPLQPGARPPEYARRSAFIDDNIDLFARDAEAFGSRGAGCCLEYSENGRCKRPGSGEQCAPVAPQRQPIPPPSAGGTGGTGGYPPGGAGGAGGAPSGGPSGGLSGGPSGGLSSGSGAGGPPASANGLSTSAGTMPMAPSGAAPMGRRSVNVGADLGEADLLFGRDTDDLPFTGLLTRRTPDSPTYFLPFLTSRSPSPSPSPHAKHEDNPCCEKWKDDQCIIWKVFGACAGRTPVNPRPPPTGNIGGQGASPASLQNGGANPRSEPLGPAALTPNGV